RAYAERVARGNTFIPRMPKFARDAARKATAGTAFNPVTVDETGGGVREKLERMAKGAKGTPEGERAAEALGRMNQREGKTFIGRIKKAASGIMSKFRKPAARPIAGLLAHRLSYKGR